MFNLKNTEVLTGYLFLVVGIFFTSLALVITLFPSTGTIVNHSVWVWLVVSFVCISLIETGISWIKQAQTIDTQKIEDIQPQNNILSKVTHIFSIIHRY